MNIYKKLLCLFIVFVIIFFQCAPLSFSITNNIENKNNVLESNTNTIDNESKTYEENATLDNDTDEIVTLNNNTKEDLVDNSISDEVLDNNLVNSEYNSMESNQKSLDSSNPFYDFISKNDMDLLLKELNIDLSIKSGIYVPENFQKDILEFLNGHSSYTYTFDKNNTIVCDNKLRENKNLDIFKPIETEMDLAIKEVIHKKKIILIISPTFYEFDKDKMTCINFDNSKYLKTYENNSTRIIILNCNKYCMSNNLSYNPDIQDSFIKSLTNVQYRTIDSNTVLQSENNVKILSGSPQSISASSIGHQTVYGGPNDNGTYAIIGSVDDGESVKILGKEDDYYHIEYDITYGTYLGKKRTGYILRSNLNVSLINMLLVHEESMDGGYRYSSGNNYIESYYDFTKSVNANSSVSNTEGVTLLYTFNFSFDTIAFVEYSTSNGMKRGYINNNSLINPFTSTLIKSPARVDTYTGPDSDRFPLDTGAVALNEYACAIGYYNDYVFLEYNTNSGRRRAFAKSSDLDVNISSLNLIQLPNIIYNQTYSSSIKQNVSAGPGACFTLCAYRGVVGKYEPVYKPSSTNIVYEQLGYSYIVYHVGSSLKGGYVPTSTLSLNVNPTLPTFPTYNESSGEFSKTYIGQTGLGQPLYAYKIGTGNNKIYLCFNQHGWEDGGTGDGVELVKLAIEFMNIVNQNKSNNVADSTSNTSSISEINFVNLLQKWTIYVIPSINRDGITSGWTNYGPGRSDVVTAIDINRNWDTSVYTYNTDPNDARNYNGTTKMATSSCQAVAAYLTSDSVKPNPNANSILLDIHGWDNEVITWDSDSKQMGDDYFVPQFSDSNFIGYSDDNAFRSRVKASYGAGGYLMRWAVEQLETTNSMLVELPLKTDKTIDHDFIVNNNYSTKLTTAILNMMKNEF